MRKIYIKPEIIFELLESQSPLLDFSTTIPSDEDYSGGDGGNLAKPVEIESPDLWEDDEDEENIKLK